MLTRVDAVPNCTGACGRLEMHYQYLWGLVQYKWGFGTFEETVSNQQVAAAFVRLDLGTYSCCKLLLLFGRFISQVHPFFTFGHVRIVLTAQAVFLVCLHFALMA